MKAQCKVLFHGPFISSTLYILLYTQSHSENYTRCNRVRKSLITFNKNRIVCFPLSELNVFFQTQFVFFRKIKEVTRDLYLGNNILWGRVLVRVKKTYVGSPFFLLNIVTFIFHMHFTRCFYMVCSVLKWLRTTFILNFCFRLYTWLKSFQRCY